MRGKVSDFNTGKTLLDQAVNVISSTRKLEQILHTKI